MKVSVDVVWNNIMVNKWWSHIKHHRNQC